MSAIGVEARRLVQDWAVPAQAQPRKVLEDCGRVFLAASRPIDVLHTQKETLAGGARLYRRVGMADVEKAGRAGREAGDDHGRSKEWRRHRIHTDPSLR